jgi:diaminohydroxyphosphoribosylaminopyrimidine deaminase/5-amino-6-(5-phosphoribosylamino)uracil reductase
MSGPQDHEFMARALALAEEGRGYVEPNPMVGAVLVKDGRVVAEGYHERFGAPHAEAVALDRAGPNARGATLYVTLEPCCHPGKTPPCAPRVAEAGVRHVLAATPDPTPKTAGKGAALLRERGVDVTFGLCGDEAVRLNAGFFKLAAVGLPLVIAKWAMTLDGRTATRTGDSKWISSAESRRFVHEIRGQVDCVIVGTGTVKHDDPLLTCRDGERRRTAARLVMCGADAPALQSQLVRSVSDAPVLLAYRQYRPPPGINLLIDAGCTALPLPEVNGRVGVDALLAALGDKQMTNVLIEGGSRVMGGFFDADAVDKAVVFVGPRVFGGEGAASPVAGAGAATVSDARTLLHCEQTACGRDVLVQGWVHDPVQWLPGA